MGGDGKKGPPTLRTINEEDSKPKLKRNGPTVIFDMGALQQGLEEDVEEVKSASPKAASPVAEAPPPQKVLQRRPIPGMLKQREQLTPAQKQAAQKINHKLADLYEAPIAKPDSTDNNKPKRRPSE
jgi:hypothetical protein